MIYFYLYFTVLLFKSTTYSDCIVKNFHSICSIDAYEAALEAAIYPEIVINKKQIVTINDSFTSACVQCLLCLTIAREFEQILLLFHKTYPPKIVLNSQKFNETLSHFCENKFKNFDLQEYKNNRYLEKRSKTSKHVACGIEGMWPKKLKDMCRTFMEQSGERFLYLRWFAEAQKPNFDITHFLCRSYGIFQHCRNLPISLQPELRRSRFFYFN